MPHLEPKFPAGEGRGPPFPRWAPDPRLAPEFDCFEGLCEGTVIVDRQARVVWINDRHAGRLVDPGEIASLIGYVAGNEAIDATTLEITGGLCHPKGIAK